MAQDKHKNNFTVPGGEKKILLHLCCATCVGPIIEQCQLSGLHPTIFFYNPNIHPRKEYQLRKAQIEHFSKTKGLLFIDAGYDPKKWLEAVKDFKEEPEGGRRCDVCFGFRLTRAADYAHAHGFKVFTSSLGIARFKDMDKVNHCGQNAAKAYPNLVYWTYNWRKHKGSQRMYEIAKEEGFYKQEYCGCMYSLKETNRYRRQKGRGKIKIGQKFY